MSDDTAYRIERLRARLAQGESAELGLRIEAHADTVNVSGTVADVGCRDAVQRIVAEELDGLTLHLDLVVCAPEPPVRAEQL
jgi:hypothetical protein